MWKEVRTPIITVAFFFIALVAYTQLLGPIPFSVNSVQTTKSQLFSVSGEGEATAIPDTAQITMGVSKKASTVEQAQEEVNTIINQIKADLTNLGIKEEDIKTTNYSVNPNYDYTAGREQINGYNVNADLRARIESVDTANQAIDAATKAGATNVGNVQFILDDETKATLEDEARKEAIEKAKMKAESLSSAAGIKLGRIIDVQENTDGAVAPFEPVAMNLDRAGGGMEKTELNPGENKVRITVTLSYETL